MLSNPRYAHASRPPKLGEQKPDLYTCAQSFVGKLHQVRVINTGKQRADRPPRRKNAPHHHSRPRCSVLALLGSQPWRPPSWARKPWQRGWSTLGTGLLPDGRYLVTERPGRMRIVEAGGRLNALSKAFPPSPPPGKAACWTWCWTATLPATASSISASRSRGRERTGQEQHGPGQSPALGRRQRPGKRADSVQPAPKIDSALHFGCRIVERKVNGKPDGSLFLTLGERYKAMQEAQNLQTHLGKIVRVNKDGSVPRDNPFAGRPDALAEIWSYGHRNSQGAALGPETSSG
jgi:glucose/arabinose dehydrogenase